MAIESRDAVKKYGRGASEICALDHVNLRIDWMQERLRWRVWSLQSKTGKN